MKTASVIAFVLSAFWAHQALGLTKAPLSNQFWLGDTTFPVLALGAQYDVSSDGVSASVTLVSTQNPQLSVPLQGDSVDAVTQWIPPFGLEPGRRELLFTVESSSVLTALDYTFLAPLDPLPLFPTPTGLKSAPFQVFTQHLEGSTEWRLDGEVQRTDLWSSDAEWSAAVTCERGAPACVVRILGRYTEHQGGPDYFHQGARFRAQVGVPTIVPETPTLAMMAIGLAGLGWFGRRR